MWIPDVGRHRFEVPAWLDDDSRNKCMAKETVLMFRRVHCCRMAAAAEKRQRASAERRRREMRELITASRTLLSELDMMPRVRQIQEDSRVVDAD